MVVFTYSKYHNNTKTLSERALGIYLGRPVEFCHAADGAPYLSGENLKISVSHTGEYFALAASQYCVGIDIERRLSRNIERLSERCFPDVKIEIPDEFYSRWTAMEAEYKCGRYFEPRYFEVFKGCTLAVCAEDTEIFFIPLETFD